MARVTLVFDSWAILAFLQDEPAAAEVEGLLAACAEGTAAGYMTVVNLGEIWYTIARRVSPEVADGHVNSLQDFGLSIVDADWPFTHDAAAIKARHRLSYADAFAAALAKRLNAQLVTADPEFKALEKEVRIHWLPMR